MLSNELLCHPDQHVASGCVCVCVCVYECGKEYKVLYLKLESQRHYSGASGQFVDNTNYLAVWSIVGRLSSFRDS